MRPFFRAAALVIVVMIAGAVPFSLALAAWPGPWWAILGVIPAVVALSVAFLGAEGVVARAHGVPDETSATLGGTLARVLEERGVRGGSVPRVAVFPNPLPMALVARSARSAGTVLISEGAAIRLSETDLRRVLDACLDRAEAPGIVVTSACAVLSSWLLRFVPRGWVGTVLGSTRTPGEGEKALGTLGALVFLVIYPVFQALEKAGSRKSAPLEPLEARGATGSLDSSRIGIPNPGFLRLYMNA